jgi:hypothetical protein
MGKFNRSSRIKNWSLGECIFRPEILSEEYIPDEIPLANLSESGLGLWIEDTRVYLPPGIEIPGEIKSPYKSFNVKIKVVRKNNFVYGCSFTHPVQGLSEFLNEHYGIEKTASSMINIRENLLASRPEGAPHWHSDGFSELYYLDNSGLLVYYRIHFQERQLERIFDPALHFKNLQEKTTLNSEERLKILRFLNHINELSFPIRKQILNDIDGLVKE